MGFCSLLLSASARSRRRAFSTRTFLARVWRKTSDKGSSGASANKDTEATSGRNLNLNGRGGSSGFGNDRSRSNVSPFAAKRPAALSNASRSGCLSKSGFTGLTLPGFKTNRLREAQTSNANTEQPSFSCPPYLARESSSEHKADECFCLSERKILSVGRFMSGGESTEYKECADRPAEAAAYGSAEKQSLPKAVPMNWSATLKSSSNFDAASSKSGCLRSHLP